MKRTVAVLLLGLFCCFLSPSLVRAQSANLYTWNGTAWVRASAAAPVPISGTITCTNCSGSGVSQVDNTAFTPGTSVMVPIGGYYTSGADPALTTGNAGRARIDSHSYLYTDCAIGCSGGASTPADAFANPTTASLGMGFNMGWNGTTWDRLKSTTANGLQVDVTRVQGTIGVTQSTNPWVVSVPTWAGGTLGAMANYGTSPGAVLVPGVNAFITNAVGVTQSTNPWVVSVPTWAGGTLGAMANYGTSPGAVLVPGMNAFVTNNVAVTLSAETTKVIGTVNQGTSPWVGNMSQWGSTTLGTPTNFGTTPGAVIAGSVNAAQFIGTTAQANDGTAGFAGVGGHFADNGVAAATNRIPTLDCIYQTSYLNGSAATQGRNGAQSCGTDGLLWTAQLPSIRPASYHWSGSFAGSSTTFAAHIAGNATNTLLVTRVMFSCTQTTAGSVTLTVNKTSAASTGGTAATLTAIPDDSNYSAASSVAQSFTGTGPTVGTPVGQIDAYKLGCNATGTAGPNDIYILNLRQKPIVLRGTAQTLEIGVGAATTGGNYTATFEGIETATITP